MIQIKSTSLLWDARESQKKKETKIDSCIRRYLNPDYLLNGIQTDWSTRADQLTNLKDCVVNFKINLISQLNWTTGIRVNPLFEETSLSIPRLIRSFSIDQIMLRRLRNSRLFFQFSKMKSGKKVGTNEEKQTADR